MARRFSRLISCLLLLALVTVSFILPSGADRETISQAASGNFESRSTASSVNIRFSDRDSTRIDLSFTGIDIREVQEEGASYHHVSLKESESFGREGAPDVPVIRKLFAIPECDSIAFQVHIQSSAVYENVNVYPCPKVVIPPFGQDGHEEIFAKDEDIYSADADFPGKIIEVEHVGYMRGQRLALVAFYPVQFNPVRQELKLYTNLQITLQTKNPRGEMFENVGPMQNILSHAVANYGASGGPAGVSAEGNPLRTGGSGQVCWCEGSSWQETAGSVINCGADYLIILADSMASDSDDSSLVEALAHRRAEYNGFNVAIAPLGQIVNAALDTANAPVIIRSFIDSVYESQSAAHMADGRLAYVLLLGDAYDPARNILIPSYYGYPDNPASDAYYSFMDADPEADRFSDVFIGRLPIDNDDTNWEMSNVIDKILAYEPLPLNQPWVDKILMVSGGSDRYFSFQGEGGNGFKNYFDLIQADFIPSAKTVNQLHRLLSGSSTLQFSKEVSDSIDQGYWLTGLFDHGKRFYLLDSFYPTHYDTLKNYDRYPVIFSIACETGYFDYTYDIAQSTGSCCTGPRFGIGNLGCNSPPTLIDSCDALSERLIVQPNGAIGVFAFSREQSTGAAQSDFANLFKSIFIENASTLGDILLATKLTTNNTTTIRSFMLFGDPALNIVWREGAQDSIDLAIRSSDIKTTNGTQYINSNKSNQFELTVRNLWKYDVYSVDFEIWDGDSSEEQSTMLSGGTIDSIKAYGSHSSIYEVSSLSEGEHEIFVYIDPDSFFTEPTRANNSASREFIAYPYIDHYPVKLNYRAYHSVMIADVDPSTAGKELLFSTIEESYLYCYSANTSSPLWEFHRSTDNVFPKSSPLKGNLFKDGTAYVVYEANNPSYAYILNGSTGAIVDSIEIGDVRSSYLNNSQNDAICDIDKDNEGLELLTFVYHGFPFLYFEGFSITSGEQLFSELLTSVEVCKSSIAVADIDNDGEEDIVLSLSNPSDYKELRAYNYRAGNLVAKWSPQIDLGGMIPPTPAVVLFDRNEDAEVEILCSGKWSSTTYRLFLYNSDGTQEWWFQTESNPYYSVGDIDGDATKEIVLASDKYIRILSPDGSTLYQSSVDGWFINSPLLADIDNDSDMEIITVYESVDTNNYIPPQYTHYAHIQIFDNELNGVGSPLTFPGSAEYICMPAVDDVNNDGKYELAFVSKDSVFHVIEIGSNAGKAAWPQRYNNPMHTNLLEQPLKGSYSNDVSLFNNVYILGDVTLDSVAAPAFYVDAGTKVRVNTADSTYSGNDPSQCEVYLYGETRFAGSASDSIRIYTEPYATSSATWVGIYIDDQTEGADILDYTTLEGADIGIENHSPFEIQHSRIENTFDTGVMSEADITIKHTRIINSEGQGVCVGLETYTVEAIIESSYVDHHAGGSGIKLNGCAISTLIKRSSASYNGLHGVMLSNSIHGTTIESSRFIYNYSDGIRCDEVSPIITKCQIKNNGIGVTGMNDGYPFLGDLNTPGHNCIQNNSAHHIVNLSPPDPIYAQFNYWGTLGGQLVCCPKKKFSGYVVCNTCDASPSCDSPSLVSPPIYGYEDDTSENVPKQFDLGRAVPNPFNPTTIVPYQVPSPGAYVKISVYNVLGQKVIDLLDGYKEPGYYTARWTGMDSRGTPIASGIYFVSMRAGNFVKTIKAVVLK